MILQSIALSELLPLLFSLCISSLLPFSPLTESIQDTSPRIHPSRNKKPVSEKLAPRIYPWGQGFNLKSKI